MKNKELANLKKRKLQLLLELSRLIAKVKRYTVPFGDMNSLLGFRIAWLKDELAARLFKKYGLNPKECEVILMQADGLTKCHLHKRGESIFLPLSTEHGAVEPDGGTLFGDFDEAVNVFKLEMKEAKAGQFFTVPAGKIHAFKANKNSGLTLIALVNPKIRQGEESFDAVPFRFLSEDEPYKVSLDFGSQDLGWQHTLGD